MSEFVSYLGAAVAPSPIAEQMKNSTQNESKSLAETVVVTR